MKTPTKMEIAMVVCQNNKDDAIGLIDKLNSHYINGDCVSDILVDFFSPVEERGLWFLHYGAFVGYINFLIENQKYKNE